MNRDVCKHFAPAELVCITYGENCPVKQLTWHYPAHNLDLPNMPEPGETVVAYYCDEYDTIEHGPIIHMPIKADGSHINELGRSIYMPITRWCRIPEV